MSPSRYSMPRYASLPGARFGCRVITGRAGSPPCWVVPSWSAVRSTPSCLALISPTQTLALRAVRSGGQERLAAPCTLGPGSLGFAGEAGRLSRRIAHLGSRATSTRRRSKHVQGPGALWEFALASISGSRQPSTCRGLCASRERSSSCTTRKIVDPASPSPVLSWLLLQNRTARRQCDTTQAMGYRRTPRASFTSLRDSGLQGPRTQAPVVEVRHGGQGLRVVRAWPPRAEAGIRASDPSDDEDD